MNLRIVAAIAQKDLVDAIRNLYLLVALVTPLSVALLIRLMAPGMSSVNNFTIVVHDPGQSALVLVLMLAFGMTGAFVVPLLLVEEKEKRTMDFLLTSPAGMTEIIAGKALTGLVYSVVIAGALLGINRQLIGNWPRTLLTVLLGLLLIVSIGLLMGSFFKNTMQVNTWASVALLVLLAGISGSGFTGNA